MPRKPTPPPRPTGLARLVAREAAKCGMGGDAYFEEGQLMAFARSVVRWAANECEAVHKSLRVTGAEQKKQGRRAYDLVRADTAKACTDRLRAAVRGRRRG